MKRKKTWYLLVSMEYGVCLSFRYVTLVISGIYQILIFLQGPTPKNDFCRIFARSSVLQPLSMALVHVIEQGDDIADHCVERIVNIFYIFSQAENQVKETIAERSVLKSMAHSPFDLKFTF